MKLAALAALALIPIPAVACLNVENANPMERARLADMNLISELRTIMDMKPSPAAFSMLFQSSEKSERTEVQRAEEGAVDEIFKGNLKGALELLQQMEQKWSGRYSTAANLGTTYELLGDNENALKWITVGIQRNPQSHDGTEWVHVLVLKAKLEAAKHAEQPLRARLIPLPEGMDDNTGVVVEGKWRLVSQIAEALHYQLAERMLFVKPKDVYVADLLYSTAMIRADLGSKETALELLEMAKQYGFADEALLARRAGEFGRAVFYAKASWWATLVTWSFAILGGLWLLLRFLYQRKILFLSGRAFREHRAALRAARVRA